MHETFAEYNQRYAEDEDERAERWRKLKAERRRKGLNPDGSPKKPHSEHLAQAITADEHLERVG